METDDEKQSNKVDELFEQIEVKPRYKAVSRQDQTYHTIGHKFQ